MPKRKRGDHYDDFKYLLKKIKHLEDKLSGDRHKQRDSPRSPTAAGSSASGTRDMDIVDVWALSDEDVDDGSPSEQADTDLSGSDSPHTSTYEDEASPPADTLNVAPPATTAVTEGLPPVPVVPAADPPTVPVSKNTEPQLAVDPPLAVDAPAPVTEESLDPEFLEILGMDPTAIKKYGKDIQKDLSVRLEHCATNGLSKESRKEFSERYLTPENCKLIDPPLLNAEIKAAVTDVVFKRDKAIETKQKQLTSAISCLGEAITLVLSNKEKNTALLKLLIDSTKILCDCQHADSVTRRNFLLSSMKKEMKEQLQNTKIDKYLFSETLAETLKSAKAITKSGADLKISAPKAPTKKTATNTSKSLNWKSGPARRQLGPPRTKEPAPSSTRTRPMNTSRPSQHQQQRSSQRRR